jgi:redox-sensitive bicupin YhaK (pirin superfamily)
LWVNLPGRLKMIAPRYQDVPRARIATASQPGATVRVIAGEFAGVEGAADTLLPVRLLDVSIEANAAFELDVPDDHACFVYVYEGEVSGPDASGNSIGVARGSLALLSGTQGARLQAGQNGAKILFADGKPIREPIARYGPFVMNTREEVQKAFEDYSRGELVVA